MGDLKDIMGLPREAAPPAAKSKKSDAPKLVKPKGMSRSAPAGLLDWLTDGLTA